VTKTKSFLTILVAVAVLASWPVGAIAQSEPDVTTDAAGRPIEDPTFGVRSVVPTDWQDAGGGIYTRGTPPEDPVLMAIQSAPITTDGLWQALLPQFALTDIPEAAGELITDHFEWTLYEFDMEQPGAIMAGQLALTEKEGSTYLVLVVSDALEADVLREQAFLPAIKALEAVEPEEMPDSASLEGVVDLDAFLTEFVGDADGGVVGRLTRDGETTNSAVGAATADGQPMDIDTAFRVGSISKLFVSTMVLQLVDAGLVDLDAPLSTYLPETSVGGDVTVRSLLSHRSGIPSYTDQPGFFDEAFDDLERSLSIDEVLDYVADVPAGEPDQVYSYSNTNYILLGQLLETVGDSDLESALLTRIVEPLGLEATTFDVDGSRIPDTLAGGWSGDTFKGDPAAPYEAISSGAWSAGSLVSTTADLATFLTSLFEGELVSDELLAEMLDTEPDGYGLGIGSTDLMLGNVGSKAFYGHNGGIPGYISVLAGDPETGDIVVLLSNSEALDPHAAAAEILRAWAAADG